MNMKKQTILDVINALLPKPQHHSLSVLRLDKTTIIKSPKKTFSSQDKHICSKFSGHEFLVYKFFSFFKNNLQGKWLVKFRNICKKGLNLFNVSAFL